MSKPKFIKPLLIGCACAIPLGLVVGLSVNWDHRQFISSVGSSGVKPFIESFGKQYINENPKIDVQVESGGTTFAIEEVAKGLTNVGNASNNPYYTIEANGYFDKWQNKKTFTLGWEGLVIMYKMPDGLTKPAQDAFDIVINDQNILQLYAVFSGFAEDNNGKWDAATAKENASMWHYLTKDAQDYLEELEVLGTKDKEICQNTPIIPFVRSGGNTAANSSIAFSYYSNLVKFEDMTVNQQNAFSDGQYGTYCKHYETEESNARSWEMFSKLNKAGSMVYLTTGFVKNKSNQKAIIKNGYKLAGYQKGATDPVYLQEDGDLNKIATVDGYNWYRPINCMIDVNNNLSRKFVDWIYKSEKYESIVKKNGARPLSTDEYNSMLSSGELFSEDATDIELLKVRRQQYGSDDNTYGAEELWKR